MPPVNNDNRLPDTLGSKIIGTELLFTFLGFKRAIALLAAILPMFIGGI